MSVEVRISLAAADIPGDPRMAPLVALQPAMDTAQRANAAYVGRGENFDWGMPGPIYVHNCLPIQNGYTSVKFNLRHTLAYAGAVYQASVPYAAEDTRGVFVLSYNGTIYEVTALAPVLGTTGFSTNYSGVTATTGNPLPLLTVAHVNGKTYVASGNRAYATSAFTDFFWLNEFSATTGFSTGTTGIPALTTASPKRAIAGLGNYLLLVCDNEIYYSSPGQPNDFTGIGAGQFTPSSFEGVITSVKEIANGVIIYTTVGAWSIVQTFNGANPFKSKQLAGITGVASVAAEPGCDTHYVYSTNGFHAVQLSSTEPILLHQYRQLISDTVCTFDTLTTAFSFTTNATSVQHVSLHLVDSRYLVINYKTKSEVWIYDTFLRRLGKVRGAYDSAFSLANIYAAHHSTEAMLYLLSPLGQIYSITGDNVTVSEPRNGALVVGPIVQQRNDRRTTIHSIYLQNNQQSPVSTPINPPTIKVISSKDTVQHSDRVVTFTHQGNGLYLGRVTGRYLYIVIEGDIETSNLLVKLTASGM